MRTRQRIMRNVIMLLVCLMAPVKGTSAQDEAGVRYLTLTGPAADSDAELSGLAWFGDTLLLLAENPNRYAADGTAGAFFALDKTDIQAYLDADRPAPLEPWPVPIIGPDIVSSFPGFDGFEAAVFSGDRVFLVIEAKESDGMTFGYLVSGTVEPGLSAITLDVGQAVRLPAQTGWENMGYESVLVAGETIVVVYELNGAGANPAPRALVFDADLTLLAEAAFPPIPFRVTDVAASPDGTFWALNNRIPMYGPQEDDLPGLRRAQGSSHQRLPQLERLVAFHVDVESRTVTLAARAPIYLRLPGVLPRNWEGLARLDDRGFLLVSDEWPGTLFGFAATP